MIKLIIFDLGGVCFNYEEFEYCELLAEKHSVDKKLLAEYYDELLPEAEIDNVSAEEIWGKLFEKYNIDVDVNNSLKEMIKLKKWNVDIKNLIEELRKTYKTAYYGNYLRTLGKLSDQIFDLSKQFDYGVYSFEIKARKPGKEGFMRIMAHFSVKPGETLFIDDSERNVKKAEELGIKGIKFDNLEQLKKELIGKL